MTGILKARRNLNTETQREGHGRYREKMAIYMPRGEISGETNLLTP